MVKEVAVFLDAEGTSASLSDPGKVVVYRRANGSWEIDREKQFSIGHARGMRELRLGMSDMLQFLAGCKIIVTRSATGVPYFELEKGGCSVWEITGRPEEFLDQVWQDEERENLAVEPEAPAAIPVPEETSPGHYFISIKAMQEKNAGVSSKQVLLQFVLAGNFKSLAVVCSHVPPWIEAEALRAGLAVETEKLGKSEFKVRVVRNC
ncbi:Fe-only nitrogenase accessory AnfO family protein [Methanocella sp. MCL-LM]|uniref:Fe-only nitrogenase accessory AnfO family protein n=1 Tax=Methanocella sp. MCL-LM TaxID=3412035 RepID=UPI003C742CD8